MNLEEYREDIEAIKLGTVVSARLGLERESTIVSSIRHMEEFYDCNPDERYLTGILLHIQAYLELGMDYRKNQELFDRILEKCGLDKNDVFPKRFYYAKKVKLNKSQVRGMIRKWTPSPQNTMQIQQVVADIIDKVKENVQGVHYYRNHTSGSGEDDIYELVIQENECFFHDIMWERYYVFYDADGKFF